jgi:hypothetical protein
MAEGISKLCEDLGVDPTDIALVGGTGGWEALDSLVDWHLLSQSRVLHNWRLYYLHLAAINRQYPCINQPASQPPHNTVPCCPGCCTTHCPAAASAAVGSELPPVSTHHV